MSRAETPSKVPPTKRTVTLTPRNPTRQDRIEAVKNEHYQRLGVINTEADRAIAAIRQQAQEKRRVENARFRKAIEEARAA